MLRCRHLPAICAGLQRRALIYRRAIASPLGHAPRRFGEVEATSIWPALADYLMHVGTPITGRCCVMSARRHSHGAPPGSATPRSPREQRRARRRWVSLASRDAPDATAPANAARFAPISRCAASFIAQSFRSCRRPMMAVAYLRSATFSPRASASGAEQHAPRRHLHFRLLRACRRRRRAAAFDSSRRQSRLMATHFQAARQASQMTECPRRRRPADAQLVGCPDVRRDIFAPITFHAVEGYRRRMLYRGLLHDALRAYCTVMKSRFCLLQSYFLDLMISFLSDISGRVSPGDCSRKARR